MNGLSALLFVGPLFFQCSSSGLTWSSLSEYVRIFVVSSAYVVFLLLSIILRYGMHWSLIVECNLCIEFLISLCKVLFVAELFFALCVACISIYFVYYYMSRVFLCISCILIHETHSNTRNTVIYYASHLIYFYVSGMGAVLSSASHEMTSVFPRRLLSPSVY